MSGKGKGNGIYSIYLRILSVKAGKEETVTQKKYLRTIFQALSLVIKIKKLKKVLKRM